MYKRMLGSYARRTLGDDNTDLPPLTLSPILATQPVVDTGIPYAPISVAQPVITGSPTSVAAGTSAAVTTSATSKLVLLGLVGVAAVFALTQMKKRKA